MKYILLRKMQLDGIVIRSNETALYEELKKARELILYQTL
jgi:hypothetical protein